MPYLQAQHVLSGRLPAADYQSKILCCGEWRRKGAAYDLAPLGNQMPSSVTPEFRPLPKSTLQAAFTLQPGSAALSEVRWLHMRGNACTGVWCAAAWLSGVPHCSLRAELSSNPARSYVQPLPQRNFLAHTPLIRYALLRQSSHAG